MLKRLHLLLALFILTVNAAMAQITTSGISGKITSDGENVIGATVTATHQPSGTVYRAVTNIDGRYTIQGMRPGGPYKVDISYIGYKDKVIKNLNLSLGETENISCSLQEDAHQLQEVVVSGKAGLAASRTGAATSMTAEQINNMPSITHGIADVARLNPQLTVTNSGNMSFAGVNNRYNNFMIDGAANNDVFGLASSGNNGGQAGAQPVSMETIEQIQVSVAPFDVRQSGFTGGAINAITKAVPTSSTVRLTTMATTRTSSVPSILTSMARVMRQSIRSRLSITWVSPSEDQSSRTSSSSSPTMSAPTRSILISMV